MYHKLSPISVICSTRKIDEKFLEHLKKKFSNPKNEYLIYENNNEFSLSQIYNKGLLESKNNICVFIHDDIEIETNNITPKINILFENNKDYGIIGLAGTDNLVSGTWWEKKESMYGIVGHIHNNKRHVNYYSKSLGDNLKQVVVIDGLFMCIDKSRIKHNFNEEFNDFHFYDLPICLLNHLDGVKVGVTTKLLVTHRSIGMVNKKWEKNKYLFNALYEKHLPIKIS